MISSKNLTYIQIPLSIVTLTYLFFQIPFVLEFLIVAYSILSIGILVNGFRFKAKRDALLQLGIQENFNGSLLGGLILFFAVAVLVFFGTKLVQWDVFPTRASELSPYFVTIIAIPQLMQFLIRILFNGFVEYVYLTDNGVLFNMNATEHYLWKDFDSYAMLPDLKLIRFRKIKEDKPDFFFVAYEDKHLNEHKEQILAILDKNLQREIE